ncbi:PREDICTED: uncharacterized protein LOC109127281 [Camelina sativa]|uniref:Uncharacterized protein LOC109127281 n=1 Tax=Camelina sativa TaxID=90675 RepID=A0ABM1QKX2_CAMSA|nr:PREDICTED: uncharacterized protein LOC109127281 [Camelina sativa]
MFLMDQGYVRESVDKNLFVLSLDKGLMFVQIYVDEIVFRSTCQQLVNQFVQNMTDEFEMSMCGELTYFLGLQVQQSADGISMSQSTYARGLVTRFGLTTSKEAKILMGVNDKLSKDEAGEDVDEKLYRGMIGSFLYLTSCRPDIGLAIGVCARYQARPKKSHLLAVKKIIKYIKGTVELEAQAVDASSWETISYPGTARSKTV